MNPNWWLVAIAFALGVLLTYLWSVRRVTRQVRLQDSSFGDGLAASSRPTKRRVAAVELEAVDQHALAPVPTDPLGVAAVEEADPKQAPIEEAAEVSWWEEAFIANRPDPAMLAVRPAPLFTTKPRPAAATPETIEAAAPASRLSPGAPTRLAGPAGEQIKGNRDSMLFHTADSPWYALTKAEQWFTTEAEAEAAGFTRWDRRNSDKGAKPAKRIPASTRSRTTKTPARPSKAASAPASAATPAVAKKAAARPSVHAAAPGGEIKGNRDSMLYHTVDSPWYGRTKAEEWFATEAEAKAAGFTRWDHKRTRK
ncbi:hypothetical protein [Propionicimonas sp.]|uniref:channel accessory protein ArfC n=1 Tax=Propionicimonas sp. TaxID=1955623 RepID=UPI00185BECFC|nr:hypothetical protein [Propionicimonas sp.]MBU3975586.1 hypothetical protein [Actinomycetota bacterium]MBA3020011.1 hypothetical protein [Propionicimonas sp.]MBU3986265.1 hypothetical protein [Actinomycetota bacterium]MBU4007834.1 hypothetical protein [Actinomycetota bacterium]MBU4064092.1 hypothetical protein [Actinomycetota bacterium]